MDIYSQTFDNYLRTLATAERNRVLDDLNAEQAEWAQAEMDIRLGRY